MFKTSTRIKKVTGIYTKEAFDKVLEQFHGRALVVITCMNIHCPQCIGIMDIITSLEQGNIRKLEKLVLIYGYGDQALNNASKVKGKTEEEGKTLKEKSPMVASSMFKWDAISDGHGYAIFTNKESVTYFQGEFDHSEFKSNIMQALRRFDSSVFTLADLSAKKNFIEKKRTGIIIETKSSTNQKIILDLEESTKVFSSKMKVPIYFLQGLKEEISIIKDGSTVNKQDNLDLRKFMKKIVKMLSH